VFFGDLKRELKVKVRDPKDKKTILSRDVTLDEASIMKPTDSQQVESKKTTEVSH